MNALEKRCSGKERGDRHLRIRHASTEFLPALPAWAVGVMILAAGLGLLPGCVSPPQDGGDTRARGATGDAVPTELAKTGSGAITFYTTGDGGIVVLTDTAGHEGATVPAAPAVDGSGAIRTEARPITGVGAVELRIPGELSIRQESAESLSVEADDNVLPLIDTAIRGDTLVISVKPGVRVRAHKLRYVLATPDIHSILVSGSGSATASGFHGSDMSLSVGGSGSISFGKLDSRKLKLDISGSGNIRVGQLHCDDITADVGGAGEIELAGQTHSQSITINGSGGYAGGGLQSSQSQVNIAGSGSVSIACADTLSATINGSGNLSYAGSPRVKSSVSGSGQIRQVNH